MRKVLFAGNPVELLGKEAKKGDKSIDFTVTSPELKEVKLSDFEGKTVVITAFPSVDTSVCSMQGRKFNEYAAKYGDDVQIMTISADLPFALARYCAAEGIDNIVTTSDHKSMDFAEKYGFILDDMRLLERGVVIIDKNGVIQYVEYVDEVTNEPDYDKALAALDDLLK